MTVVVPYVGELQDIDARMVRLAEFMGISCEILALPKVSDHAGFLATVVPDQGSCFVLNPQVMKEWVGVNGIPTDLVAFLLSRFPHLLVHGLHENTFDTKMVATLSRGRLKSVEAIEGEQSVYLITKGSNHVCGAFAGLSFGPVDPANDHVFCTSGNDPSMQQLISIGARPFMAAVRLERAEILFVGSGDVADIKAEVGDAPLSDYFSKLVPHAMALRHVARDECWRPSKAYASISIDDPLLRRSYGFLNFESLLRLADKHNFHATVAFIPHNFRRNSSQITRMFQENASRLSICFHGNDHTDGEFASTDPALIDSLVRVAEDRMNLHYQMTGLPCDKVMAFPQGRFSIEAMKVLKSNNFYAAVNTTRPPAEYPVRLTIGELAQPAVLRYGGFPLFIRKPIKQIQDHNIAFNLFFGRPVLMVEHHETFQHPEPLVEMAARINSMAPEVHWTNLAAIVENSLLARRASDGTHHIRAYSGTVQVCNKSDSTRHYWVEWCGFCDSASIEQVLVDGAPRRDFDIDSTGLLISVKLAPGETRTLSVVHRSVRSTVTQISVRVNARAFVRRRLSEFRDNYLSKNQRLLTAAGALQRRFLKV
jgi:peptidoglycan/xylan/chitin deacetylase (PgdA/CDA1 family)